MQNMGDRIRAGRLALRITQPELADLVGVSKGTISMWETGITKPKGMNLLNLAAVLKLSPSHILHGTEPKGYGGKAIRSEIENDPTLEEVFQLIADLSPEDQLAAVEILKMFAKRGKP